MDNQQEHRQPSLITQKNPKYSLKLIYLVFIVLVITLCSLAYFLVFKKTPQQSSQINKPLPTTIKSNIKSTLDQKIEENVKEFEEVGSEVFIEEVKKELGIISPTLLPTVPMIPTPTINTTQEGSIPTESAFINSLRMYNAGKFIPVGDITTIHAPFINFIEIDSNSGQGSFKEPIKITYTWIIGNKRNVMSTRVITGTGLWIQPDYRSIYDPVREPELLQETEATLEISGATLYSSIPIPSFTKSFNYKLVPETSRLGTYGIAVSVGSDRSKPEILDRKVIVGAMVTIFNSNQEKITSLITKGGVDVFRNLPSGTYILQADYKGYGSFPQTVTINSENENGHVFLIVPIKPEKVDGYTATVFGQISTPYSEFYEKDLMKNQVIKLYKTGKEGKTLYTTTTTDAWGAYKFSDIPGDTVYSIVYDPPLGWTIVGDEVYNSFQVFSIKDRAASIGLNKSFN